MLDSDLNVVRFPFLLRFDLKFSGQISHGHISAELTDGRKPAYIMVNQESVKFSFAPF